VEDQQPDSGDLTTDVAEKDDATDAKATRRRHRMPLRKQLDDARDENVVAEEVTTETAEEASAAEAVDAPRRNRWGFFRRRAKTAGIEAVSDAPTQESMEAQEPEEPRPAPRTPVGKARRTVTPAEKAAPVIDDEPTAEAANDDGPETAEAHETADAVSGAEEILVPHRPAGKRLSIATAAAGVLFVCAAAFAAATLQPYLTDRAVVHTKLEVARTATNAIATLWTYTPDNMDSLPDRAAGYLGGDFAIEYRKYIDAIVAPNKQAQVTNTTQVMGAAVESLTGSEATAIVYTNSVATSPVTKNIPSLRYLSYRLTLERRDAKWLITRMSTVTSLDLTPQL
jgi:Mce-associated membrane protein